MNNIYARCNFCMIELKSFEEAIQEKCWRKAMQDEIEVMEKNKTWELFKKPKDKEVIGVKWIYKVKYNVNGTMQRTNQDW